jgi:glycosyltransferase involved in cell wall biosynthesis
VPTAARRVVIAANSSWNIVNYRQGLIRALKSRGYEPIVVSPLDPADEERLNELGVERIAVEMDRSGLNPFTDLRLLLAYRRILRRVQPIALLSFTIKPNIYGCLAAGRIPSFVNISGLGTVFIKRGLLLRIVTLLYRFALERASLVFFQNPDDRELFVKRRLVRPGKARLLPGSGVDLVRFRPVALPHGRVTFLFIGRLLGDKGIRELVEAARKLHRDGRDVSVQLLGPIDEHNRTAISRVELDGWLEEGVVDYLGTTDDVRPFIGKATAIVLPSYREGLPLSLLEAGAMGRLLIATDVPGCRQVVEDGLNGFLCEVRNPVSLADAMNRVCDLPEQERSAMGAASRRKIEAEFSEALVIDSYLELLGELHVSRSLAS